MKDALVNIERRRIREVGDTGTLTVREGFEIVAISDADAATVEASEVGMFLVDGAVVTLEQKREAEREAERVVKQQQRWAEHGDEFKAAKLASLQAAARSESESDILVDGIGLFHVDAKTLIHLQGIEALIADGTSPVLVGGEYPNYKCVDGAFTNLSAADMVTIRAAIEGRDFGIYSVKLFNLTAAVAAATSRDDLDAIVW